MESSGSSTFSNLPSISTKHINKYLSIFRISNIEGDTLDSLAQAALSASVGAVLPRTAHEAALLGPARPLLLLRGLVLRGLVLRDLGAVPGPVLQPGRGDPGVRGEDVALAVVITQRRLGRGTVGRVSEEHFLAAKAAQ